MHKYHTRKQKIEIPWKTTKFSEGGKHFKKEVVTLVVEVRKKKLQCQRVEGGAPWELPGRLLVIREWRAEAEVHCAFVLHHFLCWEAQLPPRTVFSFQKWKGDGREMVGCFSAASNITGILADVETITITLHRYRALSLWDYATAAPYVTVDMNPVVNR